MLVKPLQPWKASLPIDVTPTGMIVDLQPEIRVFVAVSIIALHPSRESYTLLPSSTSILVKLLQVTYLQPVITQYFASNKSEIWS